jgi:hypothetical protein
MSVMNTDKDTIQMHKLIFTMCRTLFFTAIYHFCLGNWPESSMHNPMFISLPTNEFLVFAFRFWHSLAVSCHQNVLFFFFLKFHLIYSTWHSGRQIPKKDTLANEILIFWGKLFCPLNGQPKSRVSLIQYIIYVISTSLLLSFHFIGEILSQWQ